MTRLERANLCIKLYEEMKLSPKVVKTIYDLEKEIKEKKRKLRYGGNKDKIIYSF